MYMCVHVFVCVHTTGTCMSLHWYRGREQVFGVFSFRLVESASFLFLLPCVPQASWPTTSFWVILLCLPSHTSAPSLGKESVFAGLMISHAWMTVWPPSDWASKSKEAKDGWLPWCSSQLQGERAGLLTVVRLWLRHTCTGVGSGSGSRKAEGPTGPGDWHSFPHLLACLLCSILLSAQPWFLCFLLHKAHHNG